MTLSEICGLPAHDVFAYDLLAVVNFLRTLADKLGPDMLSMFSNQSIDRRSG